jgi:CubicO group peptidase (beta-lactamase class C family)
MGTVLVARGDKVLFSKGYGFANLEWRIPNDPATKFRIGSITKQFTAAAILLLEERGKLAIDEHVKTHLPDVPAAWNRITLRHLLTHTSGIPDFINAPGFAELQPFAATPEELVAHFRGEPLEFEPGSQYSYSNSGYILLSYLIEKISGENYERFIRENLFAPLGMNDSGYDSNSAVIPHRAAGYVYGAAGFENAAFFHMSIPQGAGGLYSTTEDLLKWTRGLFGGKVLKPESLAKMTTPFLGNYALGLSIESVAKRKVIRHSGGIDGFDTEVAYYPSDQVTIVVLSNVEADAPEAEALTDELGGLLYGDKRPSGGVFSGALERVRYGSIAIRLADGLTVDAALPPSGELTATAIAASYRLGDQVQIDCAHIRTLYDSKAALHLHLAVKSMRLVRAATSREQAHLAEELSWRTGDNVLKLPAQAPIGEAANAPAMALLERARKVSLDRVGKMPNFVADEIGHRFQSEGAGQPWKLFDTVESEVSVKDSAISRENIRRNGVPSKKPLEKLDGPGWGMFFGVELKMFHLECPTKFEFAGVERIGGRQLRAYRFNSPSGGCNAKLRAGREEYEPARTGRFLIDERGEVLRYECEGRGVPEKFLLERVVETESWDYVTIGGSSYLVPVAASMSLFQADGTAWLARIEYRNHRHFESSAAVMYAPGK